jgi:hypothetical protein
MDIRRHSRDGLKFVRSRSIEPFYFRLKAEATTPHLVRPV